jgi:hypothetical protein
MWKRLRRLFGGRRSQPTGTAPVAKNAPAIQSKSEPPNDLAISSDATAADARDNAQEVPTVPPKSAAGVSTPAIDLVLGVDFGTSCSKVVIGDPSWQNTSLAVSFAREDGDISAWLDPTRFGSEANLKMRLMSDPTSEHVRNLVACYLAKVITYSRSWFDLNRPAEYGRRGIRWSLNLGFPDKSVKGSRLAAAYQEVANIAVAVASQPEPPSPELVGSIRRGALETERIVPPSRVQLYPEIAAQLAGYINSPYRRKGNLLLIDVGAGTLDVSTIILHGDQEQDIVSFHFCEVQELGVLRLYDKRVRALEAISPGSTKYTLEYFQDGSRPVPESFREMVHAAAPALERAFCRVTGEFAEDILGVVLRCLIRFRRSQREVHSNRGFEPWGRNLRFFLTGGGCRSRFYKAQLVEGPLEDRLAGNFTRWHPDRSRRLSAREGLLLERFPLPPNLINFPKALQTDFDRLSVAYGLAFGGENLMKVTAATHK